MSEGLTRQERIERRDAHRKAREELRTAVRFCMTKDGVSSSQIRESAIEMAKHATNAAMKTLTADGTFEALVRKVVREEADKLMVAGGKSAPGMQTLIMDAIKSEAAAYAKSFIDKNILIQATEKDTW